MVKSLEIRSKLDGVRCFNNKLPGKNVNESDDDDDGVIIKLTYLLFMSNNNINNNNKKNKKIHFSYNKVPDVPTLDTPDIQ